MFWNVQQGILEFFQRVDGASGIPSGRAYFIEMYTP
jgi:hypothetical protein